MSFENGDYKIPKSFQKRLVDHNNTTVPTEENNQVSAAYHAFGVGNRSLFGTSSRLFTNATRSTGTSLTNNAKDRGMTTREEEDGSRVSSSKFKFVRSRPIDMDTRTSDSRARTPTLQTNNDGQPRIADREKFGRRVIPMRKGEDSSLVHKTASSDPRRFQVSRAAVKKATKIIRQRKSNSTDEAQHEKSTIDGEHSAVINFPKNPSSVLPRELSNILKTLSLLYGRHCPTNDDRIFVLDERDKLLYKLRTETELISRERLRPRGECTDMCPENERYKRVRECAIARYECDSNGDMRPELMVKNYARSAADQEKPLPHEMRTTSILKETMNYLLRNVLDSLPEDRDLQTSWYDFLWSRTRAIRKEVTQLMLSDTTAVALVERCTRLHILCAYKLCELEVEKFDQNMNTENLAKSLQTLRHLYDDLDRQGIHCETEAEFRAYDVMLHLHDSNVLRQVLSYRKDVRESRPVRLAIQLSSALQNKNYVRFFRLMKNEASFLQCCICHRFFNRVRADALLIVTRSFSRRPSIFPYKTLTRTLAFDNVSDAENHLLCYGMQPFQPDPSQVLVERFNCDETPMLRTYRWIDMKQGYALSQVVYGPEMFDHSPLSSTVIDSFDEQGYYTQDPVLIKLLKQHSVVVDQHNQQYQQKSYADKLLTSSATSYSSPTLDPYRKLIEVTQESIIDEIINDGIYEYASIVYLDTMTQSLFDDILDDFIKSFCVAIWKSENIQLESETANRIEEERRREMEKITNNIAEQLLDTIVLNELQRILKIEWRTEVNIYLDTCCHWIIERLWNRKLYTFIDKHLQDIISLEYQDYKEELDHVSEERKIRWNKLWIKQFWDVWRAKTIARVNFRRRHDDAILSFEPNWKLSEFDLCGYVSDNNSSDTCYSSVKNVSDIRLSLDLRHFHSRRLNRIVRKVVKHWMEMTRQKISNRSIAKQFSRQSDIFSQNILKPIISIGSRSCQTKSDMIREFETPAKRRRKSFVFLHPDDSFFDSPLSQSSTGPKKPLSNTKMNSTALTWHTDISFDYNTKICENEEDSANGQMLSDSVLTNSDMIFARSELNRIRWTSNISQSAYMIEEKTIGNEEEKEDDTMKDLRENVIHQVDRLSTNTNEMKETARSLREEIDRYNDTMSTIIDNRKKRDKQFHI